jgi:hypothetical protein
MMGIRDNSNRLLSLLVPKDHFAEFAAVGFERVFQAFTFSPIANPVAKLLWTHFATGTGILGGIGKISPFACV